MRLPVRGMQGALLFVFCLLNFRTDSYALDLQDVLSGFQRHYASVETAAGSFRQTYRAPGIDQEESGVFWLKKPGLMRWEYRDPEEKLFVADGREFYLYVPRDRQVTVQPYSVSDLHRTPLEFLLGARDIQGSFLVSWETDFKRKIERTHLIRLTPRQSVTEYEFLILEFDQETYELRRIVIREAGGNTSEFFLTDVTTNVKLDKKTFQFKPPTGTEILQLDDER